MKRFSLLLFLLGGFFLIGCTLFSADTPSATSETDASGTTSQSIPLPTVAAETETNPPAGGDETAVSPPITDTTTSLIVWIPPEIAGGLPGGDSRLLQQLEQYQQEHPELDLIVQQKATTGQGSILNYLRTGRDVAPAILPDLIAVPADQLEAGFNENLLFPVGGLVSQEILEDLYPAALDIALTEATLRGIPFILTDQQHLVFNQTSYTETLQSDLTNFVSLSNSARLVFPANGESGVSWALQIYLANGGTLQNEAEIPALLLEPLRSTLQTFLVARNNGLILSQSSNISSLEEAWQLYANGTANMSLTSSELYLRNRADLRTDGYAPLPGIGGAARPFVNGWVWALSSSDAANQQNGAELIEYLMTPENLGGWSTQAGYLPARRAAFDYWPADDPYTEFIRTELERAEPFPLGSSSDIVNALENALFDVVSLSQTAQLAAEEAINEIQP